LQVKVRPVLRDRCPLCPACPVCNVCVLCPHGWMDQDATWYGSRSRPRRFRLLCPTERGTAAFTFRPTLLWHCRPSQQLLSERKLTFTFAICYRPSVCLSVCRLSVCNVRAPYSGGSHFRQYFYDIRYLGHPLTFAENFTEIVPGEPLRRGS